MIERKFVENNIKEFQIKEFVKEHLGRVGLSDVKLQKTPLGEKIIISASRPGLVVGRAGANITKITKQLKKAFKLENPQIEIEEIKDVGLDASIIAELIAGSLERFGSARFKGIGHKAMSDVIGSGALGVEILISGKIPGSRAKRWRFYKGYLKKCGDISIEGVLKAYAIAKLKTGIVGIKVSIMPSTIELPDKIELLDTVQKETSEVSGDESKEIEKEISEEIEKTEDGSSIVQSNTEQTEEKVKETKKEGTKQVKKEIKEKPKAEEKKESKAKTVPKKETKAKKSVKKTTKKTTKK